MIRRSRNLDRCFSQIGELLQIEEISQIGDNSQIEEFSQIKEFSQIGEYSQIGECDLRFYSVVGAQCCPSIEGDSFVFGKYRGVGLSESAKSCKVGSGCYDDAGVGLEL